MDRQEWRFFETRTNQEVNVGVFVIISVWALGYDIDLIQDFHGAISKNEKISQSHGITQLLFSIIIQLLSKTKAFLVELLYFHNFKRYFVLTEI